MSDMEAEIREMNKRLQAGWAIAADGQGLPVYMKVRPPQTHMGCYSLDIDTSRGSNTVAFSRGQLVTLATKLVGAL